MSNPQLDVRHVASLACLDLSDEEIREFSGQLGRVLEHVNQLRELDAEGVEPTAHAHPVFNVFRKDEPREGLGRDQALGNAPARTGGLFLVTKVIE